MSTTTNAALLKIKKSVSTKLDMANEIIRLYTTIHNMKLSDTEILVLSYFMLYGINNQTKNLIISSRVCKNINVIKGIMTRLKKAGLIYKDELNSKNYVAEDLDFNPPQNMGIYLRLNIDANEH